MRKLGYKLISTRSYNQIKDKTPGLQTAGLHGIWFTYNTKFKHMKSALIRHGLECFQDHSE